jgi:hypothetical protein
MFPSEPYKTKYGGQNDRLSFTYKKTEMKNRYFNISKAASVLLFVFACSTNEDDLMQPYVTGTVFPEITEVTSSFFDVADVSNAYVEFIVDVDSDIAESISIEQTFSGSKSVLETFTTFPVTFKITAAEAVSEVPGLSVEDLELGDSFLYEVIVTSKDGLRTRSNVIVNAPVACSSDLGGAFTYSTTVTGVGDGGDIGGCSNPVTGEGEFVEDGAGFYRVSDATFGQYDCAWGDTPAVGVTLTDVCNTVTVGGSDQYGLIYTFIIISNDGTELKIDWSNDYGDSGTSILIRKDGKTWPLDLEIN